MEGSMSSLDGSITSAPESHCWNAENLEELKHLLMCTSLELESTREAIKAQEQMYNAKVRHLEELLRKTETERDEARQRSMQLDVVSGMPWDAPLPDPDSFLLPDASFQPTTTTTTTTNATSIDYMQSCGASTLAPDLLLVAPDQDASSIPSFNSSYLHSGMSPLENSASSLLQRTSELAEDAEMKAMLRCLPERGKLLQAVMQAGPLLHTLMLAGPLPQWHHPPPVMDSFQIPQPSLRCGSFVSSTCL